ncbi:GIY-YIG nuclease family protein [Paenimyroides aestuarii]|uniref:GIY-YIG nuclease family protein n=1 Tax=Paenimyroides aestuarii TaxID=2968490 RepID=A0ABY5NSR9_9FLAO|nr:GIY-YIG nuclease family protein [Paenimyroides aestuarii]UUV21631.1 GIY-YIG nuclease family protein [Paenimyroides aestuarii]
MFYTYILYSTKSLKYYVGQTNNLSDRINRHNTAQQIATKNGIPWILITYFECQSRSEAVQLENKIKKRGGKRFLFDIGFYEI